MRRVFTVLVRFATGAALGGWLGGCPGIAHQPVINSGSIGTVVCGLLQDAAHLPDQGAHFRFYKTWDRRYGVPALTGLVVRAANEVAGTHPGSVLLVGDLSAPGGGFISDHVSHRTGRDVDLAFFATDPGGRADPGTPLVLFDRFGVGAQGERVFRFDAARNWRLVEALLTDGGAAVQWIFVSKGLKAILLDWALEHGADLGLVERAAAVLHQPEDSKPHDDHFHVRIYCPPGPVDAPCVDTGPRWPWTEAFEASRRRFTREELVRLALEPSDG